MAEPTAGEFTLNLTLRVFAIVCLAAGAFSAPLAGVSQTRTSFSDTRFACVSDLSGNRAIERSGRIMSAKSLLELLRNEVRQAQRSVRRLNENLKALTSTRTPKGKKQREQLLIKISSLKSKIRNSQLTATQVPGCLDGSWPIGPGVEAVCGNLKVEAGEQCDDGNLKAGDCCSPSCQFEPSGASCGTASQCSALQCNGFGRCDSLILSGACDDRNACTEGDKCSNGQCQGVAVPESRTVCGVGSCRREIVQCISGSPTNFVCVPGLPTAEICNGLDDDCDDQVDNGLGKLSCGVGACKNTVDACVGGRDALCVPIAPTPERCDGVDNDCDGAIDENIPDIGCGVGACRVVVSACSGNKDNTCTPLSPNKEICNGLDDDCNGAVDENLGTIQCGVGACANTTAACVGGKAASCTPKAPAQEICNGIDDDCDGTVDEGLGTITCGVGSCSRTISSCLSGLTQSCLPGTPGTEICNGADDNCNGVVDEGEQTCGVGACQRTIPKCSGGVQAACIPGSPGIELCNNIDDDCDGLVDEPGSESSCPLVPNTIVACQSGCKYQCKPGYADSDANPQNGCDIDLSGDPLNCGRVGNACPSSTCMSSPACVSGVCLATPLPVGTSCGHIGKNEICQDGNLYVPGEWTCNGFGGCIPTASMRCDVLSCTTISPSGCIMGPASQTATINCPAPFIKRGSLFGDLVLCSPQ